MTAAVSTEPLSWHYGPTDTNPDPGRMWCYACGAEVFAFKDGRSCTGCGADDTAADQAAMLALLDAHATVNSTAAWDGSPDPTNWRNIRRVCKCGDVIGWHTRGKSNLWQPLSGYAFDGPHREHIADVLAQETR